MGNKKTRITWLCILALLAGVFMGPLSLPVAAEETEKAEEAAAVPLALNPGAADMRVGVMADSGFIRSNGLYAQVYYTAQWSGDNLNSSDTSLSRGQAVYCVEPNVPLVSTGGAQVSGHIGEKDWLRALTTEAIPQQGVIFTMLGQVLKVCGMPQGTGPQICQNPALGTRYLAAQLIIWQIVEGDMDAQYQLVGSSWKAQGLEGMRYYQTAPAGGRSVVSWYEEWMSQLKKIHLLPSFAGKSGNTPVYTMDSSTLVLTDENASLPWMRWEASDPSVSLRVEGNRLTVSNPEHVSCTITAYNTLSEGAYQPTPIFAYDTTSESGYTDRRQTTIVASSTPLAQTVSGKFQIKPVETRVQFEKKDAQTKSQLTGAVLQLQSESGEVLQEWTSGSEPHVVAGLKPGLYVLHEKSAPSGYVTAADISFEVQGTSQLQTITMFDDVTKSRISKKEISSGEELPGAVLQILDQEGNVVAEWTSTGEPFYMEKLPVGQYILHEVSAPDGYATAPDIPFTVSDTGEIQAVAMVDEVTRVQISKKDLTTGKELPGAKLQILNAAGELVLEWTSGSEPYITEKLPVGKYTLREISAPEGYVTAEEVVFTVEDTGEIQTVAMSDDITKVQISKTDLTTGKELTGAKLQIINAEGEVVEEWISRDQPHYIEKLPVGEYTLREVSAPSGYVTAEDVIFTVQDTGEIQKVSMADDITRVTISKLAGTSGEALRGAKLQIRDQSGQVMKEWVSNGEDLTIEKLPVGTYVLHEVEAPEGYSLAEDLTFEVKDSAAPVNVIMEDTLIPEQEEDGEMGAATGDFFPWSWYLSMGGAAVILLSVLGIGYYKYTSGRYPWQKKNKT